MSEKQKKTKDNYLQHVELYDFPRFNFRQVEPELLARMDIHCVCDGLTYKELMTKIGHSSREWAEGFHK